MDRHDLDSAAPLAHGLLAQGAKVIDVGTGAGFPGMPLLILRPDLQITFLDALNKRILFLEDALKRLGLTAATLHARAEDAAKWRRIPIRAAFPPRSQPGDASATLPDFKGRRAIAWRDWRPRLGGAARGVLLLGGTVRGSGCASPPRADWAPVLCGPPAPPRTREKPLGYHTPFPPLHPPLRSFASF